MRWRRLRPCSKRPRAKSKACSNGKTRTGDCYSLRARSGVGNAGLKSISPSRFNLPPKLHRCARQLALSLNRRKYHHKKRRVALKRMASNSSGIPECCCVCLSGEHQRKYEYKCNDGVTDNCFTGNILPKV